MSRTTPEPMRGEDERRPIPGNDHRERARKRMAEIRAEIGDAIAPSVVIDRFYAEAPEGWAYNWKLHSVFGKEYPQELAKNKRNFWTPVPSSRHRDLLYEGYTNDDIVIDGLILVERPKELHDRFARAEHALALDEVQQSEAKMREAPEGTPPRSTHPFTRAKFSPSVGPVDISD